jgi:hypothetical protein
MEFKLKCILIETKPRTGYYVANQNQLVTINKTDMKKGLCYLSNGNKITLDQAKFVVAKLIGEVTMKDKSYTYSIVHGDYPLVMPDMNCPIQYGDHTANEDKVYKTYAEALIAGESVPCNGDFETIFAKAEPKEVVEITDIDIIDKNNLYNKPDRLAIIESFDKAKQTFTLSLNIGETIVCKRKDFKKAHASNTITMLRIQCPHCKRYGN